MRTFLIIIVLLSSCFTWAGEFIPMYRIMKDTIEEKVPEGMCRVYGKVTFNDSPLASVKVSTVNHKQYEVSDNTGMYSFLIDAKKIKLYAFQIGFREVVTEKYNFRSGYAVQIDFYMREKIGMIMEEKPVIYMYSPTKINAEVNLDLLGDLTFSYPKYEKGWNVSVGDKGTLTDENSGKEFPYLFWEGKTNNLNFSPIFNSFDGYQINTDSTIQFLEARLSEFGLNDKEQTDFITYWAPRISNKKYAVVQFLLDEEYDTQIGKLNVSPMPDCVRRVYILFAGINQLIPGVESTPKKFIPLKRSGFTVIEWGGSELNLTLETSKL